MVAAGQAVVVITEYDTIGRRGQQALPQGIGDPAHLDGGDSCALIGQRRLASCCRTSS